MKVLFIVPYPSEGPSNRFRVEQFFPILTKEGICYSLRPFCNAKFYSLLFKKRRVLKKISYVFILLLRRIIDIIRAGRYDITFIHREASPTKDYIFEMGLRLFSKKVIYDFDDAVFLKKPAKVRKTVSASDCVIAGNQFLAAYALRFNKNITILPTCIDTQKYNLNIGNHHEGKIVIGWIGTPSTSAYLSILDNVFTLLSQRYNNIQFRVVGAAPGGGHPAAEKRSWSLKTEIDELRQFSIGIMPMHDSDWTKGKCAFKIIQYMAMGIPAVASPVGMNLEVIRENENGFFAGNDEEWVKKLSMLIESPSLRRKLGAGARETAEEKYSLINNGRKFVKILKDTYNRRE